MSENVAWLAGILEGEGCFTFYPNRQTRTSVKPSGAFGVEIQSTDQDVVDRVESLVGTGSRSIRCMTNPNHRDAYSWKLSRRADVLSVLLAIRPYMLSRRAARIDEMIAGIREWMSKLDPKSPQLKSQVIARLYQSKKIVGLPEAKNQPEKPKLYEKSK